MQLDRYTHSIISDLSRSEARPMREVLRKLVSEAVAARHRTGGLVQTPSAQIEADSMSGRVVGVFLPGRTRHALCELADKEGRSVSSTAKLLIREALIHRGVLQTGNDPR